VLTGLAVAAALSGAMIVVQLRAGAGTCLAELVCPAPAPGETGCGPVPTFCPDPQLVVLPVLALAGVTGAAVTAWLWRRR